MIPERRTITRPRRLELIVLLFIVGLAAWFRLQNLPNNLHWLDDEGRDAMIVRQMITSHRPVLIGPPTSIITSAGPLYVGPLAYYLMAPGLWLAQGSPVGMAVVVVVLSLATVVLLWWVGRTWWHPLAGLAAAGVFALSANAIVYGRHAWNPNLMPFFSLLVIWAMYQATIRQKHWWWLGVGLGFSAAGQMHVTGWLLLPVIIFTWLWSRRRIHHDERVDQKKFWLATVLSLVGAVMLISPLVVYDAQHNWYQERVVGAYFHEHVFAPRHQLPTDRSSLRTEILAPVTNVLGARTLVAAILAVLGAGVVWWRRRAVLGADRPVWLILISTYLIGLIALSFNPDPTFPHYREFMWPVVCLGLGWFFMACLWPWRERPWTWGTVVVLVVAVATWHITRDSNILPPSLNYPATVKAAEIISTTSGQNIFSLSFDFRHGKKDAAFLYELSVHHLRPDEPSAMLLYVICDDPACRKSYPLPMVNEWALNPNITLYELGPG